MRKDWEVKKLGDVCSYLTDGDWIESKDQSLNGIRLIQTGNIGKGFFRDKSDSYKFISESTFNELNCKEIFPGDILVSRLPEPVGRACIVPNLNSKLITAVDCTIIRTNELLLSQFFIYYTMSKVYYSRLKNFITGAVRKRISRTNLSKIYVPVPPLQTQQQIVEELDCLTSIIEKQKKQLEELDNLAQAIFYDMFGDPIENEKGWETSTIDNVCLSIIRGPFGSALKKEFFVEKDDSTYKVYEQKNAINKNAFIGTYYISKEMYKSLSRFEVFPNDIIMSCSGTIGELYVIPYEAERGIINQALLKFTLNKKIERDYFLFMMNQMKSKMDVKGCGIQNIGSVKYIKATVFGLPPLPLQQQFASKIEAIEKQKELIKKSIKETEGLFNSRMDYYFN